MQIARGIKTQIRPGKARCLGDAKAARTHFDPKVSGSNPGTRWLKKGHVFIVTSLPAGNGLRETLKRHCNLQIREKETQPNFYRGCHKHPTKLFSLPVDCAELITDPRKVLDSFSIFVEPISYQRIFHLVSAFYITAHLVNY